MEKNLQTYLDLTNQPPTATIIVKQESRFKFWLRKIKNKLKTVTAKDIFLMLSVVLDIELIIAIFRILAVLA